jgi:hypothetical protein
MNKSIYKLFAAFVLVGVVNYSSAQVNDDACDAIAMPTPLDGTNCLTGQTNLGATAVWSGGCVGAANREVWYTATLTGANNSLELTLSNTTFGGGDVNIMISTKNDICPADANMTLAGTYCGPVAGPISFSGLTAGIEYHIAIATLPGNRGNFDICAKENVLSDDPCLAPIVSDNYCSAGGAHSNVGATSSFAAGFFNTNACGDNFQNEVWFRFTATTNSIDITVDQGTIGGGSSEISLLQTSPDMTDCNDPYGFVGFSCPAYGTTANFVNMLIPGNVYYIAIDHNGDDSREGTFDICLNPTNYVPPAGSGYTCGTAIDINSSGLPFLDISTTTGAGNNWDEGCQYLYANYFSGAADDIIYPGWATNDKFYSFTVPAGGGYYEYSLSELNNSLLYDFMTISIVNYCPALLENDFDHTSGLCVGQSANDGTDNINSWASDISNGTDIPCTGIYLPAGNYYIIIDHSAIYNIDAAGYALYDNTSYDYEFSFNELAAASNNECGGASSLFDGVTENGNNSGCNYSYGENDPFSSEFCAFSTENLAWFTFTTGATDNTITVDLTNVAGSIQWGIVQGPCGGPYTAAGNNANNTGQGFSAAGDPCNATSAATLSDVITGLTPNTQYWFVADGNAGTPTTFDITITGVVALPVSLVDFSVENQEDKNVLVSWSTESENNNDYFLVERSYDGENFNVIDKVEGAGNSQSRLNYWMNDGDVSVKGVRYYRLKQVDFNGNYKYHEIKVVNIAPVSEITLFPNPVSSNLTITLESFLDDAVINLQVHDATGRIVVDRTGELNKGFNSYDMNMNECTSGLYFISIAYEGAYQKLKFIKE